MTSLIPNLHRAAKAICVSFLMAMPLVLAPARPSEAQITVAKFRWNAPGALSLTFDDAMPTQLIYAGPYLNQVGLKGSFYLITGNVADGAGGSPAIGKPTTWADWKALADSGHEIGSHTLTHPDLTTLSAAEAGKQLTESAARIKEKLGITPVTLAYPYNARNAAVEALTAKTYLAARLTQVGYGAEAGMANTAAGMNKYADDAVSRKILQIGMIHGITEPYAPMDPAQFLEHLKYCRKLSDEGKLWVATFGAISKYRIERDSVKITVHAGSTKGEIVFDAISPLDPAVYNEPLTFVFESADAELMNPSATRAGSPKPLPVALKPGTLMVSAVPGPGAITLKYEGKPNGIRTRTKPGFGKADADGGSEKRWLLSGREVDMAAESGRKTAAAVTATK